jgi:integrase
MNWCLSRDLIEANPAAALRRPHKTRIRSRVLGDEELRAIWMAAEELGYPFGPATQLLMLTGQRRGEVCCMRWSDVDLKERLWVMGDTKGGRPHAVPLVPRACAILGGLPRLGPYVFTTRGDRAISGLSKCKLRLNKTSGVEDWVLHDFRRTVRTALPRLGFEKHICDRVLGHVTPDVSRHYDFWAYLPQKRAALAAWAEALERIIEGAPAKVVRIR